eukprot:m.28075 g.28075  ORF g.28075 m.28075 type:complete len:90 (+) comp11807_c0_seq4:404-673(+)
MICLPTATQCCSSITHNVSTTEVQTYEYGHTAAPVANGRRKSNACRIERLPGPWYDHNVTLLYDASAATCVNASRLYMLYEAPLVRAVS